MAEPQDYAALKKDLFAKQREQVSRDSNSAAQTQNDALNRRFTALGQSGSGAAIGAQQKLNEGVEAQKQRALLDVNAQEVGAMEGDINRQFQSGENEKQRGFATSERRDSQGFSKGERLESQGFALGENQKAREAQMTESALARAFQRGLADQEMGFKRESLNTQNSQFGQTFGLQKDAAAEEKRVNDFNMALAAADAKSGGAGLTGDPKIDGVLDIWMNAPIQSPDKTKRQINDFFENAGIGIRF